MTFCAFDRRPLFASGDIVSAVRDEILRTAIERDHAVAYCFMPDHLHLVLQGRTEQAALRPAVANPSTR